MPKAADLVAHDGHRDPVGLSRLVCEAFRKRIGDDRFAVWFGESARIDVDPAAPGDRVAVTVAVASGFTHEWLRRTFRADLEAAVRDVCGRKAGIAWQPAAPAAAPQAAPSSNAGRSAPSPPTAGRAKRERSVPAAGSDGSHRRQAAAPAEPAAAPASLRRVPPGLDEFVVGPSNRMAFGAIELAASRPGEMSPLVIQGPSGVGKTHLLEAICGRARQMHAGLTVLSLSAEQFTTSFLQSLHGGGLPGFRRTCRNVDLLVIDDLQFFVGKRATLLELQHTVDALHRQGRQMVFACDRELDALSALGPELLTRLRGGMHARILPPDYEVRRGIVASICGKRGLAVPDDVMHYVATHMTRHARELMGAVNRLEATSLMLGVPVTMGMAEEALSDLVRSSGRSVRLADIEQAVCKAFGIESGSLQSSRRAKTSSHPRMLAMFLARKHTQAALAEIGSYFGRRSHSTVIAAQKTVTEWVSNREPIVLADAAWDVEEAIRRVEDVLRAG
jgi:chromosomal replication initiator protein